MNRGQLREYPDKLQDFEEVFPLRGQDVTAPEHVILWIADNLQCSDEKLREAFECAMRMRKTKFKKAAD